MKNKNINSTAGKLSIFRQLCNLIPTHRLPGIVARHASQSHARDFSHWSHAVALLFSKIVHCFGLNDLCDQLEIHSGPLSAIRGATPARRNTLSHASRVRPAAIAEDLFWATLGHLRALSPGFGRRRFPGRLNKLRASIQLIDSTVIELVANCLDWARHRRRKAAAKCHVRLDFQSLLPACVVIDTARESDARRARELTAGLKAGEIAIMDRGYVDLAHFRELSERGVFWVTRRKAGMVEDVLDWRPVAGEVLEDADLLLNHGVRARRIRARVEVDGELRELEFLTNHLEWAASTVVELYRCRWEIEVFFKQLKQTLKLCDFVGYSANAIRWQLWMALLAHMLLRYAAWASQWGHSFVRLFALVRGVIWQKLDLRALLDRYGTAQGSYRNLAQPAEAYLPGFHRSLWDSQAHFRTGAATKAGSQSHSGEKDRKSADCRGIITSARGLWDGCEAE